VIELLIVREDGKMDHVGVFPTLDDIEAFFGMFTRYVDGVRTHVSFMNVWTLDDYHSGDVPCNDFVWDIV
jgi:hypothetical protein